MTAVKASKGLLMEPRSFQDPSPIASTDSARERTCVCGPDVNAELAHPVEQRCVA